MSTTMRHTPGPWFVDGSHDEPEIWHSEPGREMLIAKVRGIDRAEPNATLIAAAPELLAALRRIIELADDPENERDSDLVDIIHWDHIRALITKAEDGQP